MQTICIAMDDKMLAAALAVPRISRPICPEETLRIRQHFHQARSRAYPAWYLFGCRAKEVEGLVELYLRQGYQVFLTPASLLQPKIHYQIIDVQFCGLSFSTYQALIRQQIQVLGYLPEKFSSKAVLAGYLKKSGGQKYLPAQKVYYHNSALFLPQSKDGVYILKSPFGAAGRNNNGNHYTVWLREALEKELPAVLAGLPEGEGVICSEFIITNDPSAAHADHVVHKMHFIGAKPYGTICQRFIHWCDWQNLRKQGVLALPDFIGEPFITIGTVEQITGFYDFAAALAFQAGRIIYSADFMVPSDGIPRFLESNKLGATFAERFDPSMPALIDAYADLPIGKF
ncbi:MAG: hypothetical protein KGZ41_03145 [Dethiobacter sp.]|nr:hypothetical protein [Dethiobacter sp.]MBS3982774.1 hypothetical protein [Dethiobacter sp.]MCL4462227.1 hypothetical protein [Bacillota bacterium]MCL5993697.1 hypothetical protein [Bacillota bacterium]